MRMDLVYMVVNMLNLLAEILVIGFDVKMNILEN